MKKFKAIIFDLDGTLVDTFPDLFDATNFAMKKASSPERSKEDIKSFVGKGVKNLVLSSLGENLDNSKIARDAFIEYYSAHLTFKSKPYDRIVELISMLKEGGFKLGVLTNKREHLAREIVDEFFPNMFEFVVGEIPGFPAKPDPHMIDRALEYLEISKNEILFVGDSIVDYYTALNSNIKCALCSWGFTSKNDLLLLKPDYLVDSPLDILQIIN